MFYNELVFDIYERLLLRFFLLVLTHKNIVFLCFFSGANSFNLQQRLHHHFQSISVINKFNLLKNKII